MLKNLLLVASIIGLAGCKDILYQDEVPKEKIPYAFSGIVELGAPVSGSKISAYRFSGLKKGERIADAVSNRDGSFDLSFRTDYEGPLLLVANGGLYRDLSTGQTTAVKPEQELQSAITHIKMPERTNINAWTTLAVARVLANRGFWDKNIAKLEDRDRIDVDFNQMSQFLSGKSNNAINIRRQELVDVEAEGFELEAAQTQLHLAHGGLSQLAKIISGKLPPGYIITIPDLLTSLSEDLSDRVFDGKNSQGMPVYLDASRNLNLSSQTMRKDFSESILLYGESLKNWNEANRLKLNEIVNPIAGYKSPEFFPEKERPAPRDTVAPKIFVSFQGERGEETPFAQMNGEVFFNVKASDETGIASLRSISPRSENIRSSGQFGPFSLDYISNPQTVASECGQEKELYKEIEARKLDILDLVCACFEAKDVFGNSQNALSCFQRKKIKTIIEFPLPKEIITESDLKNGLSVKAKVTSGVNVTSCEWWITDDPKLEQMQNPALKGQGLIESNTCLIDSNVASEALSNGEYRLVVIAQDILERYLSVGQFQMDNVVSFKVIKDPPAVEILSPKNGQFISGKTIKVVGSFEDKEIVEKILVSYKGIDNNNKDVFGSFKVSLKNDDMNIWKVELGFNLPEGEYELGLTIVDIYGNERIAPPRSVVLDESRPVIKPTHHIINTSYITGYKQIFAQSRGELDRIEPALATRFNNGKIEYYRWTSEIYDEERAPELEFYIEDDKIIKEIKYAIDEECLSSEGANILGKKNGTYAIKILPKNSRTDLLTSKELCLSLWAIDGAGNAENKNIWISWNVSTPPVSVHLNSSNFLNDRANFNRSLWTAGDFNTTIRRGAELGYAVITNQFSTPLEIALELDKPMSLNIKHVIGFMNKKIDLPVNNIEIQYFKYDIQKDKIGSRIYPYSSDRVLVNGTTTVVAKFILKENFVFESLAPTEAKFVVDFAKENGNLAALKIKTADSRTRDVFSNAVHYPLSPKLPRGFLEFFKP